MPNRDFFFFARCVRKLRYYSDVIHIHKYNYIIESVDSIIESVDSISRDERDAPLTQYIANAGITRSSYTITHFKHTQSCSTSDFQSIEYSKVCVWHLLPQGPTTVNDVIEQRANVLAQ